MDSRAATEGGPYTAFVGAALRGGPVWASPMTGQLSPAACLTSIGFHRTTSTFPSGCVSRQPAGVFSNRVG
jgi:hypothetical protein